MCQNLHRITYLHTIQHLTIRYLLIIASFFCASFLKGQTSADLQREQSKLQKKIDLTQQYLKEARTKKTETLDQYKFVEKQVKNRETMLKNISSQIESSSHDIQTNQQNLIVLNEKYTEVKEAYGDLLRSSYKQKLSVNKVVYLLSSSSLKQAFLRAQYVRQMQEYTLQKSQLIQLQADSIQSLVNTIAKEKQHKENLLAESGKQKDKLAAELAMQNEALKQLDQNEAELLKDLNSQEKEKNKLQELIKIAISREIAKASNTEDHIELSSSFAENKGRLPWPVKNGVISKSFGTRTHPNNRNVKIDNDGIDILTVQGGVVKSIFDGRVTSVNQIPGFYYVVIIKVGDYFNVYGRLQTIHVKAGDIVTRGQDLGYLAVDGQKSELQLQIWKGQTKLNPASWLIRK